MIVIKVNYTTDQPIIKVNYDDAPIYISTTVDATYIKVDYGSGGGAGGTIWGDIIGTLSDQLDLQAALDAKVPYTGATANVDLGEYELKAGQIELDQSPTGTAGVAVTRWNDTIGSTETTLKGGNVVLKNGVDLVARVVNKVTPNTTLTKAAYQAVKVSGAQGQRLAVALAQANNDNNSADTLGLVIETIATNQEGFIMTVGNLEGINTTGSLQGETWADGDVLYLSPTTPGAITNIKPNGSTGHIVVIGYVEYAHQNNGKIYVKIMNGWELDELHNVFISSPANNDALIYESATSLWKNKSIATALGYTPGTVSSVALSVPTGLVITSGSPITTSGTIAVGLQTGYSIPTTIKQSNWDDAYTFVSAFPSQTGNSGKYLTTDGSTLSWGTISTANIYNSDGTLTGNRTLTANGNSLTFLGGVEEIAGGQIGLRLQGSATTKNIWLSLKNTNASGKDYIFYSQTNGRLSIGQWNGTISTNVLDTDNTFTQLTANAVSFLFGRETNLISGLWIGVAAGSQTLANSTLLKNGNDTILSSNSIVRFYNGTNDTGRIYASTGNWRIQTGGTFADDGYKLDVQGTGRFTGQVTCRTLSNSTGASDYAIELNGINTTDATTRILINCGTLSSTGVGFGARIINATVSNYGVGTFITNNADSSIGHVVTANSGTLIVPAFAARQNGQGTGGSIGYTWMSGNSQWFWHSLYNDGTYANLRLSNRTGDVYYVRDRDTTNISFGSSTYYASAQLAIDSTTSGFLQPRMTGTQRDAITTPATGLSVYNTTTNTSDFYNGTSWVSLAAGNIYTADGTLTGNRTVTLGGNTLSFTGDIRINNINVGRGNSSVLENTAFGNIALNVNTTGNANTAIGYESLKLNTTASSNTAIGYRALWSNIIGGSNTAIGSDAGLFNTSSDNTFVGTGAGRAVTNSQNSAFGSGSMRNATTGSSNAAFGYNSLPANVTGNQNSGFGSLSLLNLTSGTNNTALGSQALNSTTIVSNNTGVGYQALFDATGGNNTSLGSRSGFGITTGTNNIIIGYYATSSGLTTGSNNTIIGSTISGLTSNLANHIILADGQGNMRLAINASGNVVIGGTTTLPTFDTYKLDVQGTGRFTGAIFQSFANNNINILLAGQTPVTQDRSILIGSASSYDATSLVSIGFGRNVTIGSGNNNIAIGEGASANTTGIALGKFATASGGVAIGTNANSTSGVAIIGTAKQNGIAILGTNTSQFSEIAIGNGSLSRNGGAVAIGTSADADQNSVALGQTSLSTAYTFVSGSHNSFINDVYFGSGIIRNSQSGAGQSYTINGSGAFGTNLAGGNITIAGGKGTGTGTSGDVIIATASATTSGTTLQTLTNRASIKGGTGQLILNAYTSSTSFSGTAAGYLAFDSSGNIITTSGTGGGGGGITRSVNNISTTTTAGAAASTDYVYLISGTTTLTLPTAVGNTNRYTLKNVGTNTVTINTTSSQTIDGSTSITMAVRYTALDVISDGTNWNII